LQLFVATAGELVNAEKESTEIRATLFDLKKDSKSRKLILVNLRIIFENNIFMMCRKLGRFSRNKSRNWCFKIRIK
jgi:hypothetical protein